jgi:hypothetical protein
MHKIKLITTDRTFDQWDKRPGYLQEVIDELDTMKHADFLIDVEYRDIRPQVINGRITHEWMDGISEPERQKGFSFVAVHMSQAQRRAWKVKPRLLGSYQVDYDDISELYFWADENSKQHRRSQFVQTLLHELRHAIMRGMGLPDDTHEVDADGQIKGSFAHLDMRNFDARKPRLIKQVSLLEQVVKLMGILLRYVPTRLNGVAQSFLGRDASPKDRAADMVGCAESVSMIIRELLLNFPIILGTWTMNDQFQKDKRFTPVTVPMPGTIIISPTGTVANAPFVGHVGIIGSDGRIMSNDSFTGRWESNYTLDSWRDRWGAAGYPVYYYQLTQEL